MTGILQTKTLASGNTYYYVKLSYKDPRSNSWKSKTLSTGLEFKNNKRKAEAMIKKFVEQYFYLEELPSDFDASLNPEVTLFDYLDLWLRDKEFLFLTEEEISDLLHFISEHYPRLLGITFMGAYYGLRRSEILGLKWSAIDFKKKTISINHTVVRVKTTNAEDSTKTQSSKRTLNLFSTAEKCLQQI